MGEQHRPVVAGGAKPAADLDPDPGRLAFAEVEEVFGVNEVFGHHRFVAGVAAVGEDYLLRRDPEALAILAFGNLRPEPVGVVHVNQARFGQDPVALLGEAGGELVPVGHLFAHLVELVVDQRVVQVGPLLTLFNGHRQAHFMEAVDVCRRGLQKPAQQFPVDKVVVVGRQAVKGLLVAVLYPAGLLLL